MRISDWSSDVCSSDLLAREDSDDTGSKDSGGDLGWIAHDGGMVQPFEDALFAMQPGDVSEPVKTDFGWHVIKLREVRSGQQTSFEEARAQLEGEQAEDARERDFNEDLPRDGEGKRGTVRVERG